MRQCSNDSNSYFQTPTKQQVQSPLNLRRVTEPENYSRKQK